MNKKTIKYLLGTLVIMLIIGSILISHFTKKEESTESVEYKVAGITKSPLYLPVFVGIEKNLFDGLEVEYVNTTGGDIVNTMLLSGEIDSAINSLNVVITSSEEENRIVTIGQMTTRGGMTLISKKPINKIKTIVSAKQGGLPNTILEKTTDYKIEAKLSPQEGVTYFLNHNVDAIMAFEPFATNLINEGYEYKSMNDLYDDIPFNCILVKESRLNDTKHQKFNNGVREAIKYIYENDSKEIAESVSKLMDFENTEILAQIIETFKQDKVWSEDLT
ncbi:MAG: ABC transporter substrate-binding protein [Bacilli bacterium]|nr:ABC transporter substrate-binding protein [Bacilli bacterium]